jgi:hypothetical protein
LACGLASEPQGERVDGKVASQEVFVDRGRLDRRQRTGTVVGFRARGNQVEVEVLEADGRRPEPRVRHGPDACRFGEVPSEGDRVAFDGDIEVDRASVEEEIAQGTADEIEGQVLAIREIDELIEESRELLSQFTDKVWVSYWSPAHRGLLP